MCNNVKQDMLDMLGAGQNLKFHIWGNYNAAPSKIRASYRYIESQHMDAPHAQLALYTATLHSLILPTFSLMPVVL